MRADSAQHDDAHPLVLVESLEDKPQLVTLGHLDDVERRSVEDDVRALLAIVELDQKAIERLETRIGESHHAHAAVPCCPSASNSPATSLRRRSFPTGDLGISLTNTYCRGRLKLARPEARQNRSSSCSSTRPRRLTKAATICPHRSCGKPTTATSETTGCNDRQLSISTGETFSPPVMIMSSTRPVTNRSPSLSK